MNIIRLLVLVCLSTLCLACSRRETVLLPSSYLSDGMVLQQNSQTRLWGKSTPGASVKVEVDWDCTFSSTTRNDSIWEVFIVTPQSDDKRHKIVLSTDEERVVISDVLIGEVWMASGESFMAFPIGGWPPDTIDGGLNSILNDEADPLLRFYKAEPQYSMRPLSDINGRWLYDSLDRKDVSAVAYYFARQLRDSLQVPVGVLISTLSESKAESWISVDKMPNYAVGSYSQNWKEIIDKATKEVDTYEGWLKSHKNKKLKYGPNGEDPFVSYKGNRMDYKDETILMSDYDYSSWSTMMLPSMWNQTPLNSLQGICWYIKSDTIPKSWIGKDLELHLGYIDDRDVTYFNGYEVGNHMAVNEYDLDRVYTIKGSSIKTHYFTIAVRVINTGGEGGFKGCPDGRMRIALAGRKDVRPLFIDGLWAYRMTGIKQGNNLYMLDLNFDELQDAPMPERAYDEFMPTVAVNGMLAPFHHVALRGVLWYHGEHNESDEYGTYYDINDANIRTFKSYLGNDISFYQIQAVPSVAAYRDEPTSTSILGVRKAQYEVTKGKSKCGTVSTMDLGWKGFHTPYKRPVGERLARMALSRTYGYNMVNDAGPEPVSLSSSSSLLVVRFNNSDGMSVDTSKCQFEVAGEDGEYYIATSFIKDDEIAVFSHAVPNPRSVRYAYRNMAEGTLKNSDGLPCVSFEMSLDNK